MLAEDKIEIVGNLRQQGVDITQKLLSPMVSQVEKYAKERGLEPSDEPGSDAVAMFRQTDNNKFAALLNDGQKVSVSQQMYLSEATYNFLPTRYKTMKL